MTYFFLYSTSLDIIRICFLSGRLRHHRSWRAAEAREVFQEDTAARAEDAGMEVEAASVVVGLLEAASESLVPTNPESAQRFRYSSRDCRKRPKFQTWFSFSPQSESSRLTGSQNHPECGSTMTKVMYYPTTQSLCRRWPNDCLFPVNNCVVFFSFVHIGTTMT